MFMQKINFIILILLFTIFTLISCIKKENVNAIISNQEIITEEILKASDYSANITDLNGTWLPNWSYEARLNIPEEDQKFNYETFSWGVAKSVIHLTNNIDISSDDPFIDFGEDGGFHVINIMQIKPDSIKVNAYQGRSRKPDERLYLEFIFHFIDYNSLWIEVDYFEEDMIYGKGALWHRLSGPEKTE